MKVLKFGGTSVGNPHAIEQVCDIIKNNNLQDRCAIIVSAVGNTTDMLVKCGKLAYHKNEKYRDFIEEIEIQHLNIIRALFPSQSHFISSIKKRLNFLEIFCDSIFHVMELSKRSLDRIMSLGELISSYLFYEKIKEYGFKTIWKDSQELIVTDERYGCAQVDIIKSYKKIQYFFSIESAPYVIFPGFIASSPRKEVTTLGRGGSDYSAAIIAAALKAEVLEIWTDVSGIMTADPRIVLQAFPIENMFYEEAIELSDLGAKVIYPPTLHPVIEKKITILVKNTFSTSEKGTRINNAPCFKHSVTGISGKKNMTMITLKGIGMINILSYLKRLFTVLSREKIQVLFFSTSEHSILMGIEESEVMQIKNSINNEFSQEIDKKYLFPVLVEQDLSIITVIGDNTKNMHRTSARMFITLSKNNIYIRDIASNVTKKNMSAVIKNSDFKKALNVLHETFFERPPKQINLFVAGIGKVGRKLLEHISIQKTSLIKELKIQVMGLCNSKTMYFEEQGIDVKNCKKNLESGNRMRLHRFIEKIHLMNMHNSIFIDTTDSQDVARTYDKLFVKGIGVITCNKIACSSSYKDYKNLKNIARYFKVPFFLETNVGAGLPIISTLNDLLNSGDKIHLIEAVLSGSINFIFNHFKSGRTFSETVREAQKRGYTEPDPRIDLSGIDVMRKILILVRECGDSMELSQIIQKPFLPEECVKANNVESFYEKLSQYENYFVRLREEAKNKGKKLRLMAKYEKGHAYVELKSIGPEHPFYQLERDDNIILYKTQRYYEQPLIIKGAGAGAEVTASGILSDLIKASR